jgi:hypothetical protein
MRAWAVVFLVLSIVTGWQVFGSSRHVPTVYHVLFSLSVVSFIVVTVFILGRHAARDIEKQVASGAPHHPPGTPGNAIPQRDPEQP